MCETNEVAASHQDVVLLPALGKVDLVFDVVAVADVDEGEILQHQSHVRNHWRTKKRDRISTFYKNMLPGASVTHSP